MKTNKTQRIILASSSPRRKLLMKKACSSFRVMHPDPAVETTHKVCHVRRPSSFVNAVALAKALSVSQRLKSGIVVGADTIIYFSGKIVEKPRNMKEAKRMLLSFSGKRHFVYTGFAVINVKKNEHLLGYRKTAVIMKKITPGDVENYFNFVDPLDKAGAYGIQDHGNMIIKKIVGRRDNVVGLPCDLLQKLLKKAAQCDCR